MALPVRLAHVAEHNHPPPFYESSMSGEKSLLDLTGSRDAFA
jgi:hypothetical protein